MTAGEMQGNLVTSGWQNPIRSMPSTLSQDSNRTPHPGSVNFMWFVNVGPGVVGFLRNSSLKPAIMVTTSLE
ncbi:uncharacterized protein METZ01_LOCUS185220 [marine metagenome]|uniref:Uncharacterized protein n=1 Tax=marine metagenome TaxID=408172 RepID=A0A382D1L1_9ZZZZ